MGVADFYRCRTTKPSPLTSSSSQPRTWYWPRRPPQTGGAAAFDPFKPNDHHRFPRSTFGRSAGCAPLYLGRRRRTFCRPESIAASRRTWRTELESADGDEDWIVQRQPNGKARAVRDRCSTLGPRRSSPGRSPSAHAYPRSGRETFGARLIAQHENLLSDSLHAPEHGGELAR